MTSSRNLKNLKDILESVRQNEKFFKVSTKKGKDGDFLITRVQISGQKRYWDKNPDIVYSLATGLAGTESDVMEYLRYRDDNSDSSSGEVSSAFQKDKPRWITFDTYEDHHNTIDSMKKNRRDASVPATKLYLPDSEQIPDLLEHVRQLRGNTPLDKKPKLKVMDLVLKNLEDPSVRYRVHNCTADGAGLRKTTFASISKQSIALSKDPSSPLSRCHILANYDNKRFVVNFMTLYYMHEGQLRQSDAAVKARAFAEELLVEYKKKPKSARGRSLSPKARSRSQSSSSVGSKSPSKKRSSSVESKTVPKDDSSVSPKAVRSRSSSKNKLRSSSTKKLRTQNRVSDDSAASPKRSSSRSRSPSPSTSPRTSASPRTSTSPRTSASPRTVSRKSISIPARR